MKNKLHNRFLLCAASATLIFSHLAKAADYWWDSNITTAGFGNTTGTWGTSDFWSTSSAGTATPAAATTTSSDTVNFGTATLSYANGTVGIAAGGVTVNSIVYGAGQTTAINLGTAGNALTLAGTSPTIAVNNANNVAQTILSPIDGSAGLAKTGAGILALSGTNIYTGGTSITAGTLSFRNLASKSSSGTHAFGAGTTAGFGVGSTGFFTTGDVDNAFAGSMTGNLSTLTVDATTNIGIDTTAGNLNYSTNIGSVSRGLTKLGTNTLTLSGSNAYTGGTTLAGGTLTVGTLANAGSNSSIGNFATAGATGLVLSGGTFNYTGAGTTTDRGFTVNGANVKTTISVGTGVALNLGASVKNEIQATNTNGLAFSAAGAGSSITISSLTITAGSSPDFNLTGSFNPNVTIQNLNVTGANVIHERTGTYLLNVGNINGTGASGWFGNMNIAGTISGYTGTIFLGGSTNFTGLSTFDASLTAQQSAIYSFNSIKNVGGGSSALGAPTTVANGTIGFGNFANTPTLRYTGTGDTTDRRLDLRGTATLNLEQAGTGHLLFTANTTAAASTKTLNLTGSTSGTGEFSGIIADNSGTNKTLITKSGTGKWTLSGANTYTGTTAINVGKLLVNGDQTAANGAVNVAANATLGGTGTLGGTTTIADTGKLEFNLSTPAGSHDKLELASGKALTFSGASTLTITSAGGASSGLYTLVTAPGGITGSAPATVVLPAGWTAGPATISGNDLVINITSTGGSAYDTWKTANAPGSNPNDDTDGDGVPNSVEFVLGGTSATNDLGKLPTAVTGTTDMTITFNRAVSSIDPKTALFIETSTDLVTWNTAPSPYTVPNAAGANNPGVTVVEDTSAGFDTVTLTVPKAPDARKFARLKVIVTP